MIYLSKKYTVTLLALTLFLIPGTAKANGGNAEDSSLGGIETTSDVSNSASDLSGGTSLEAAQSLGSQGGSSINQIVPTYSSLTSPGCDGLCTFAVGRVSVSSGAPVWEAVTGVVSQFGSAERQRVIAERKQIEADALRSKAEAERYQAEAGKYQSEAKQIDDSSMKELSENLATAVKNKENEKAKVFAMLVYKRLGYDSPKSLLQELGVSW